MPTCCVSCMTTPQAKGALAECAGTATGNGDRLQLFTPPPTPGTNSVSEKVSPKASLGRKHQKTLKGFWKTSNHKLRPEDRLSQLQVTGAAWPLLGSSADLSLGAVISRYFQVWTGWGG